MVMGVPASSGSFQINAGILGGIYTGSADEYFSLPISGAGALNGAQTPEAWVSAAGPRRQLSASFSSHSGSVIMALNFLKASISDAEEVTFGEVNTALAAATGTITLGDNEDGQRWNVNFQAALSGAGAVSGQNALFNNTWAVTTLGMVSSSKSAQYGGTIYANGAIQGSASLVAGTTVSGAGQTSGQNLVLANGSWTAAGAISASANISTGGGTISGSGGISGKSLTIGNETIVSDAGAVAATTSVVAATTVSGAGQTSGQNLVLANGSWTAAGAISASANISTGGGTISGSGGISGKSLTIANATIVSDAGALVAVTTMSAAADVYGRTIIVEGTDSLEAPTNYKITVAGGILTVTSGSY